jgi:hypothetical protein
MRFSAWLFCMAWAASLTLVHAEARAESATQAPAAYPGHATIAIEAGATVVPPRDGGRLVDPVLGLTALYLVPLSTRLALGAGISVLPLRDIVDLGFPARVEWTPVLDWSPLGVRGSLTVVVRGGVRVSPLATVAWCPDDSAAPCERVLGAAVLGEFGLAFRSARGAFDPTQRKLRFELAFSGLGGPVMSYASVEGSRPRGASVGGLLSMGVAY